MDIVKSKFIKDEKAAIKAELKRRSGYGDISKYGADNYDFKTDANVDSEILAEQGEKTINLLYAIKDIGIEQAAKDKILPENAPTLASLIEKMQGEAMEGAVSSCRAACSGLCAGSCISGCNGCSGTCSGKCSGCAATCGSGCASGARS